MLGESIGGFTIVSKLGEGGMGTVYLAEHRRIERKAAIKVLLPHLSHDQQIVERFFTEARATSRIRHPGIVEISDCDVSPSGDAFIIMELLEGQSLGNYLRDGGRFSASHALTVARNVADALAAAHDHGIVHRDLKPDNVFLLPASTSATASPHPIKLLDFGIAKLMDGASGHRHAKTRTGTLLGTPVYMSPEQCRGAAEVDHRTDIYSLGCVLFEMLCGRPPFVGTGFGELIQFHFTVTPPAVSSLAPEIPAALDQLVARMLAKSAADRPQTMRGLVAELDGILARATSAWEAAPSPARAQAPPGHVGAAGGTMMFPAPAARPSPSLDTTLGSAASQSSSKEPSTRRGAARPGRARTPWVVAIAVVVAGGGVGVWRATSRSPAVAVPSTAAMVASPAPEAPPAAVATAELPPPSPRAKSPPSPVAAPPDSERPASSPSSRARDGKVKVMITSEPAGADVCFATDRVLLGRTKLTWNADRSSNPARVLIWKAGYHSQELSIVPERDVKARVTLKKIGPDDIAEVESCQKR